MPRVLIRVLIVDDDEQCSRMPQSTGVLVKPCHPLELLRQVGVVLATTA